MKYRIEIIKSPISGDTWCGVVPAGSLPGGECWPLAVEWAIWPTLIEALEWGCRVLIAKRWEEMEGGET